MKFINKVLKIFIMALVMVGLVGLALPKENIKDRFSVEKVLTKLAIGQKPLEEEAVTKALGISYTIDTLPISNKRPGIKRKIKYIVVHNTANENSTARNERDYLSNSNNTASTSWNIVVDANEIIEAVPVTEVAFHAGNGLGNQNGIGVEICESGNKEQTEENAVKLIAYLMKTYNIPIENVKTHKDFSGKECPRQILGHWEDFKKSVEEAYNNL